MSVILSSPPPSYAFSAEKISAVFSCQDYLSQSGAKAVNTIALTGSALTLKYGGKTITMTPAGAPDVSGNQYSPGDPLTGFRGNYDLNKDFDIALNGNNVTLTAKVSSAGYDIANYNTVMGLSPITKPNYTINFKLYIENADHTGFELIGKESNLQMLISPSGSVEAPIGDKLNDFIQKDLRELFPDAPTNNSIICKKSCRRYYFEYAERYGLTPKVYQVHKSPVYTILAGGLSYIAQFNSSLQTLIAPGAASTDRFLKQGNNNVWTRTNQPQFLYYFNTRDTFDGLIEVKAYYKDGGTAVRTMYNQTFEAKRKYAFDLTFDHAVKYWIDENRPVEKFEVRLFDNGGSGRSEVRTYYMNYEYRMYVRYFLFWSSFGTMDTRLCYGKGNSEFALTQSEAGVQVQRGDDIRKGSAHAYDLSGKSSFKVATGFMSKRDLIANRDFYLSAFKYRYSKGLQLPIRIDSKTIPEVSDGTSAGMFAQQFDYSYLFDDHNYTEGDDEESGVSSGDFFFHSDSLVNPTQGLIEQDPTVPIWVKSITQADIDKWNSGNSNNSGNSGNSSGDLTNYYNKIQIQNFFVGSATIAGYNRGNWDQAFTWGDHSKAGYLTAVTGADIFHPLENQRLSKANDVIFNAIRANQVEIPGSAGSFWKIYVDTTGVGGDATAPSGGGGASYFASLLDVLITDPKVNQVPMYNGSKWINQTITFGDYYTKSEIQNFYSGAASISGYNKSSWDTAAGWGNHANQGYLKSVTWASLSGKPTNLSQFTNDLGNYGSWITANDGKLLFQPLEDQRLSVSNNVVFNAIRANQVEIPGSAGSFWKIYVDTNGNGGTGTAPPAGGSGSSYFSQLLDVALTPDLYSGQSPVWNGTKWVNQYVITDLSAYWTKTESDSRFLKLAPNSTSPQNANFAIGYDGVRNFIQSHAGKNLDLNPEGNTVLINGKALGTAAFKNISYTGDPETVAMRNGSGHLLASYFNTIAGVENGSMGSIMGLNGSDGFLRPFSQGSVRSFLGLGTGAYNDKTQLWSATHPNDYYIANSWDGTYWQLRSNHGSPVNVGHSDDSALFQGNDITRFQRYYSFGTDASTVPDNTNSFTYAVNAPYAGTLMHFGANGYGTQFNSAYQFGGNNLAFRTRNGDNGTWNSWKSIYHSGNVTFSPNADAGTAVLRDGNGYINNTYFNSSRGDETINAASYLFDTGDGYMRKKPVAWAAGELTGVSRHWALRYDSDGVAYHNGTLELINSVTRPSLGFHHAGVVASTITIEPSGRIAIMNNPGTAYENFIAMNLYAANDVSANYTYGQIFVAGTRVYSGWDSTMAGSISCNNWFRTTGPTGLYFDTYQGGIYMFDDMWIRTYGSKNFYCDREIQATTIRANNELYIPGTDGRQWKLYVEV